MPGILTEQRQVDSQRGGLSGWETLRHSMLRTAAEETLPRKQLPGRPLDQDPECNFSLHILSSRGGTPKLLSAPGGELPESWALVPAPPLATGIVGMKGS